MRKRRSHRVEAPVMVLLGCLVAAGIPARSARALAAAKKTVSGGAAGVPTKVHPLHFSCPDALDDGTLADARSAEALVALAGGVKWEGGYGLPSSCHRQVRLVCGPDLDHDGDRDAILQIAWWQPNDGTSCAQLTSSADYWPVTYTLLVSKHQATSTWRAIAPLSAGLFADDQELRHGTDFVKLGGGQVGLVVRWSNVSSDNGCQVSGHLIFAFREGALRQIDARDDSRPCTSCCDPP